MNEILRKKIKSQIKKSIYLIYFYILNFVSNRRGVWILMYHRINDEIAPSDLIISLERFTEQMWYLKKFCNVIPLKNVYDIYILQNKMKRKRKPQVVITLDDGYYDNFQNAYPILNRFKLPATIFLVTGFINTDKKMLRYENMATPDMLSWREIWTMKESGITFSPHTETHPHLLGLSRLEQVTEIQNSMKELAKNTSTGIDNHFFSYTYGEYNETTLDVLRELDIKIAVTVNRGINTLNDNPLELRRVTADGRDELVDFMLKLAPDSNLTLQYRFERFKQSRVGKLLRLVKRIIRKFI